MKYRVFSMSRLTAAIITLCLVVCLAFSMMTYFGDNLQGGDDLLAGGGASNGNVAGANYTATETVSSSMLETIVDAEAGGTVTYSANNNRGSATPLAAFNDKNGADQYGGNKSEECINERFPTKYLKLPHYGTYDFSNMLSTVNPDTGGQTLFGTEEYNSIHFSNKTEAGSVGVKMTTYDTWNSGWNKGAVIYFTVALPDNAIPKTTGEVQMDVDFKWFAFGGYNLITDRYAGLSFNVWAETGANGVAAKLGTGSSNMGFKYSRYGYGDGCSLNNNVPDGVTRLIYDTTGNNAPTVAEVCETKKSGNYKKTVDIPANTKFLRFFISLDVYDKNGQECNASVGDFKLTFRDTSAESAELDHWDLADTSGEKTSSNGATYTVPTGNANGASPVADWKNVRYVDLHMAMPNGAMTRKMAFDRVDGLRLRYYNPKKNAIDKVMLGDLKVLGEGDYTDESMISDFIYIADPYLKCDEGTYGKAADYHYAKLNGSESNNTGGIHVRLAIRTGALYIDKQVEYYKGKDVNHLTDFGVYDAQAGINPETPVGDRMTQYMVDSVAPNVMGYNITFDSVLKRPSGNFTYKYTNSKAIEVEDKATQQSKTTAYYYDFGAGPVNTAILSKPGNGTLISGFATAVNKQAVSKNLANFTDHGQHKIVMFLRDDSNNVSILPVTDATEAGDITLTVDKSAIGDLSGIVKKGDQEYTDEASWYTGNDLKIVLEANPFDMTEDFIGGLMYYITYYDPNDPTDQGTLMQAVDMSPKNGTTGQTATINIDRNVYKKIGITVVNKVDHSDVNALPTNLAYKNEVTFNTSETTFTLKRDNTKPLFSISPYKPRIDNGWDKDEKKYTLNFNTTGSVMFNATSKPVIEYQLDGVWVQYNADAISLNNNERGQILTFQMGIDKNETILDGVLPITRNGAATITGYDDANYVSSYSGQFGFRVKYPNRDLYYLFNSTAPDKPPYSTEDKVGGAPTTADGDENVHRINVKLDNVKPNVDVNAHYIQADLSALHDHALDKWNEAVIAIANTNVGSTITIDQTGVPEDKKLAVTTYTVMDIPNGNDGHWFWGTVGISVKINNFGSILSRAEMRNNTVDLYRKETDDANGHIIYEAVGSTIYYNGEGGVVDIDSAVSSVNYVTFSTKAEALGVNKNKIKVDRVKRDLGFKVETGSHVITKAVPATYDADYNKLLMQYDNNVPEYSFKVNTNEITGVVDEWHDSDVSIDIQLIASNCYEIDGYPKYELTVDDEPVVDPFANQTKQYINNITTETDANGIKYVMTSTNIAGRQKIITYYVKIDKTVDTIEVTSWANANEYNIDNIRYIAANTIASGDAISAKVYPSISAVEYYLILSDRTDGDFAFADEVVINKFKSDDTGIKKYPATFNKTQDGALLEGNFTVTGPIDSLGNKFAYILSKDAAGHYAVHTLTGNINNELRLTIDNSPYNFKFKEQYKNTDTKLVGNVTKVDVINRNTGATVPGHNLSELHVGDVVILRAEAADTGIQFLGWNQGVEDPNTPVEKAFDIDFASNKTYKVNKAMFKTIVDNVVVSNNIQMKGSSAFEFVPFKGTFNVGTSEGASFNLGTGENQITYLETVWDAGSAPTELGNFGYKIKVKEANKGDYWMRNEYAGILIVTDRNVINIIFDSANVEKKYTYNDEVFINANREGSFLVVDKFYAVNISNDPMSQKVVENLLNGNLAYNVFKKTDGMYTAFNGDVKDVGEYKVTINQQGPKEQPQEMQFSDYDIDFSVEFAVVPRKIAVSAAPDVVTKEYDGTNAVVLGGNKTWVDYVVASTVKTNGTDKELNTILDNLGLKLSDILVAGTFLYDDSNITTKRATLSDVKIKQGVTNFVLDNNAKKLELKYNATINPKSITINATNKLFKKAYDSTVNVANEKQDNVNYVPFVGIGKVDPGSDAGVPLYWWTADLCVGDDIKFVFDINAITLDTPNVGKTNFIKVDLGKVDIVNVNGDEIVNYTISAINHVENVEIIRAEVTIKIDDSVNKEKEFDGKRFVIGLTFTGLVGNDATMGEYGIPVLFEEQGAVKYVNNTKGGEFTVGQAEAYPWNIGQYTVTLGEKQGQDVLVGLNYVLKQGEGSNYIFDFFRIVPKKLVVAVDDVDHELMHNVKYYDGKTIGGKQVYNKATDKNTVSFKVTGVNDTLHALDLATGYTVEFSIVSDGSAVGSGYVLSVTSEIKVYEGGIVTDNYIVEDIVGDMKFDIVKRPIAIAPVEAMTTVKYDAEETRRIVTLDHFTDVDIWNNGAGGLTPLDDIDDAEIIRELMESKFDIKLVIKTATGEDAKNANKLYQQGKSVQPEYHFEIVNAKIERNGVQNFVIEVNSNILAYIMQVKYFISINDMKKEAIFDDSITAMNQLPQFTIMGTDYNIQTEDRVSVNDDTIKEQIETNPISYFKVHTDTDATGKAGYNNLGKVYTLKSPNGDLLDDIANYGVGTYEIRFKGAIGSDANNNYIVENIGANNEILPITVKDFKYVIDTTQSSFRVKVTPISVRVSRNRITADYNKSTTEGVSTTVGNILSQYTVDTEAKNQTILGMFKPQNVAGSKLQWREKQNSGVYDIVNTINGVQFDSLTPDNLKAPLNAGSYYISFQYFLENDVFVMRNPGDGDSINNNYLLTVYDKQYINIAPVRVYVRFLASDMQMNYNGNTPVITAQTKFYDEFNALTKAVGSVNFKVVEGANTPATNARKLGYTIKIDGDKQNTIPTGNYYLDENYPILVPDETYSNTFLIKPRPVYISMVRVDGKDSNAATYGADGFVSMEGAFKPVIKATDATTGLIEGTKVKTDVENMFNMSGTTNSKFGYKYEYMGPLNGNKVSVFDIYFVGVDFGTIEGNSNYDFMNNLTQIKGFQLTKKVIYSRIKNNKDYTPSTDIGNLDTYGGTDVHVGKADYELEFSFNSDMSVLLDAGINDYLTKLPTIEVMDTVPDNAKPEDPIKFTISANKANMDWVKGAAIQGDTSGNDSAQIGFSKAYYVEDAAKVEFQLKRKPIEINLVVDSNFAKESGASGVEGIADNEFYLYGKKGTAQVLGKDVFFNPNDTNNGENATYVIDEATNAALVTGDKIAILDSGFDIGNAPFVIKSTGAPDQQTNFITFTISFSIELDNSKYYNITVDAAKQMAKTVDSKNVVTYTKTIYVKKADANISVTQKTGDTLTYSKNFFDEFEGSITGTAPFDNLSNINISPENMKFYDSFDVASGKYADNPAFTADLVLQTVADDSTKASASIIIDETKLDKSTLNTLKKYYDVHVVPSAKITFNKADINFGRTNGTYSIIYAVDKVADSKTGKKPTTTAIFRKNMDSVMGARDYKYALKEKRRITDADGNVTIEYQAPQDDIAPLAFARNAEGTDYLINTLNSGTYTKSGPTFEDTHSYDVFIPNPDFFLDNNPLFNYVIDFDLAIEKCEVNVELYYPNEYVRDASGNIIYDGKVPQTRTTNYKYDYGTTVTEMQNDINRRSVKITAVKSPTTIIANGVDADEDGLLDDINDPTKIINMTFDDTFKEDGSLMNVGNYSKNVKFSLNAPNAASANFIIASGSTSQNAQIDINKKVLYVGANNATSNILFTSIFGTVYERGDLAADVLKGEAKLFEANKAGLSVVWYEKDEDGKYTIVTGNGNGKLTYADVNNSLQYYTLDAGHYFTAGKYKVGIKCIDTNYEVYMARDLDETGHAKLDVNKDEVVSTFLYEITPLAITINGVGTIDKHVDKYGKNGIPNERIYGETTYGGIKGIFNTPEVIRNAISYDGFTKWDYVPEIVRGEILHRIGFKLTYNDGREFNNQADIASGIPTINDTTYLNADEAKPYKATYYTNYGKGDIASIVLSDANAPYIFDFTIKKMDISDKINVKAMVDDKMQNISSVHAKYDGAWHDDSFVIEFKNGILGMQYITYTIAYKPVGATEFGEAKTYIPKGVDGYRAKPSIDHNAGLMLNAGEYKITFDINTVENKITGKKDASQNFKQGKTPFSVTYIIDQLSLADLVTNGGDDKKDESSFDNNFRDDNIVITFNTGLLSYATSGKEVANNKVMYYIDGMDKDDPMFLKELAQDGKTLVRKEGIIKNVGTYTIRVVFTEAAKGTDFINNYVADSEYTFTYVVKPKDVNLWINDSEYTKYYKDTNEVKLADDGIQETYHQDSKDINSPLVANFDRLYTNVATGQTYTHINEAPKGTYIVKFTMRPDANYTAVSNEKQIEILPKNINNYLTPTYKNDENNNPTILVNNGVKINGLTADNNDYKAEYKLGGVDVHLNAIADVFTNLDTKVSYSENIKNPIIKAYIGTKLIAEYDTIDFKLPQVGQYTLKISYATDENVVITDVRSFTVRIYQINLVDNPSLAEDIFITNGSEDNTKPTQFSFTGKTPDIKVNLSGENITFDPKTDMQIVDLATNEVVKEPSKVGTYLATIKFPVTSNFNGEKSFKFDILPIDKEFKFGDNASNVVYGNEYDILFDADLDFLKIEYYAVDAENKLTILKDKPVNAGNYLVKAAYVHPVAEGDLPNVNIIGDVNALSHAFTIDKAEYDVSQIIMTPFSGRKTYDGKEVTITPEISYFSGLPEGATLTLADTNETINDVNDKYDINVTVNSPNYVSFDLPYGTYQVTKGHLNVEVEKKTKDSITIKKPALDSSLMQKVRYRINDGEWQKKNVFKDLKPNKEYKVSIKIDDKTLAKNFEVAEVTTTVSTMKVDTPSMENILVVGVGAVAVIALGVVLGIIRHIRKKRKI